MKISRFVAGSTADALRQVKAVLGSDAVILDTHVQGTQVVVTAAVDREASAAHEALVAEVRSLARLVREAMAPPRAPTSPSGGGDEVDALRQSLAAQGVDGAIAAALVRETASLIAAGGSLSAAVACVVSGATAVPPARVECLVGLPGDGKTTTLVKLAAQAREAGQRVALVCADTYRIGGAAELGGYGRALGLPVARAADAEALRAVLARCADVDRVLIDTAGVEPGREDGVDELAALLEAVGPTATRTLVVSAAHGAVALERSGVALARLRPTRAIVTKLDAAPGGAVVGWLWQGGLPVAHVTTGRRIPDGLETATPTRLAECLLAA